MWTTNVEWQNQAGKFIEERIADYTLAMSYYQRTLYQSQLQYGEQAEWTAAAYNNISSIQYVQGNYAKALEYLLKALDILIVVLCEQHPHVASNYNNIGSVYRNQGNYTQALEYHQKALEIQKAVLGDQHIDVAAIYNNHWWGLLCSRRLCTGIGMSSERHRNLQNRVRRASPRHERPTRIH